MLQFLNSAILTLASEHQAQSHAPSTLDALLRLPEHQPIPVWEGASHGTIYGCPKINHAFRAWHDACHILGRFPFTLEGERLACEMQIAQLRAAYPSAPLSVARFLRAEVIGQAEYFARWEHFPKDQAAFFAAYMEQSNG